LPACGRWEKKKASPLDQKGVNILIGGRKRKGGEHSSVISSCFTVEREGGIISNAGGKGLRVTAVWEEEKEKGWHKIRAIRKTTKKGGGEKR